MIRHHVKAHQRDGISVSDYHRGQGSRATPFRGEYQSRSNFRGISEQRAKEIGAPEWFARYTDAIAKREERGPGSLHRIQHPSWEDLTQEEANTLRHIDQRYDATMNVRKESLDQESYKSLEGMGFVREVNGRVIPNWVFTENQAKDLGRYETK